MAAFAAPSGAPPGETSEVTFGAAAAVRVEGPSGAAERAQAPAAGAARVACGGVPRARIDGAALAHNFFQARSLVGPRVGVLAMVKSDAYGHGAAGCAAVLAGAGCRAFGVATVDEAAEIAAVLQTGGAAFDERRTTGVEVSRDVGASATASRVVVFGGILADEAEAAVAARCEIATQELDVVRALGARASAAGAEVPIHVKLDTGMHRLGIAPGDVVEFVRAAEAVHGVRVVAICSHFAQAESVTGNVTAGQLEAMLGADAELRAAGIVLERHLANSAAILSRPEAHLDMVRPGIMLYGVAPDPSLRGRADLRPVMRLVARVIRVADVAAGEGIGYGHEFRTSRPTRLATVRFGYADGYPRCLGNAAVAAVGGVRVQLVGRICMDHAMFDVTDAEGVGVGDEVTLWGDDPGVEEVAALAGTIAYELLARVGRRVRREPS